MSGLVVDASVAVKWLIAEEGSDRADALQGRDMMAPGLMRLEVANVLRTLVARQVLGAGAAAELFALLARAPVAIAEQDDALEARALEMALALGHPVYDCVYVALAERTGRVLVTADRRFLRALAAGPFAGLAEAL